MEAIYIKSNDQFTFDNSNFQLFETSLGLDAKYLQKGRNDSNVKYYYEEMVDLAVRLGANREAAKKDLLDVLEFEIKLANVSLEIFFNH